MSLTSPARGGGCGVLKEPCEAVAATGVRKFELRYVTPAPHSLAAWQVEGVRDRQLRPASPDPGDF